MKYRRVTLKMKLLLFVVILLAFANVGLGIPSYFVAKNELESKGKIILENGVNMALFIIEEHEEMVKSGVMSEEEAKDKVKELLVGSLLEDGTRDLVTPIDLGKHGYFYAVDDDGIEVMHPTLEGQYVLDEVSVGEDDKYIVREQLEIGKNGGFYEYNWYYPKSERVGPKVSYSRYEPNWGWTVVASAYTSDFNTAANNIMLAMVFLFIVTLFVVATFTNKYMNRMIKPLLDIISAMESFEQKDIKKVESITQRDELTELVNGYNQMVDVITYQKIKVKSREKQLNELAYKDVLTKLPNMNMMEKYICHKLESGLNKGFLLVIDIRDLKVVNSIYGNSYGDELICWIAECIKENKLTHMMVSRLAGNEFGVWYADDEEDKLCNWVNDLQEILSNGYVNHRIVLKPTFSIAYVEIEKDMESFSKILQKATAAMQYAKSNGMNIVKYNEEIYEILERENTIKRCAETGLKNDEFYPVYQEKINTLSKEVAGVESLARWESEVLGFIGPNEFIPVMSKSSLIVDFTEKMIDYILRDHSKLVEKYHEGIKISINISPLYFMSENFVEYLLERARDYQVPYSSIVLEITEDILLCNVVKVNERISVLRQVGIKISLDDFGTGYSSLNYLNNITLDEIKIDKSFVDNIAEDKKAYKFFKSIVDVINNFGCESVAEGVETKEQLELVQTSGCKIVQGYFYSKPERLLL